MIHTSESDITSLATSSPRSSPKATQPAYYVQSPSRDSHEEDNDIKSATSATATQATSTPTGYRSPSSESPFSLMSAASRVSGRFRRKGRHERGKGRGRLLGHVTEGEEGHEEEEEVEAEREIYVNWWKDEEREELSRSCKVFLVLVGLALVFLLSCFVVWGATRPYTAQVFLQKMRVNNLYVGEGSDETGVPSKMLTINCSLKMRVHNPATFFGIHVTSSPINLRFYDLTIASGQMETYYQPKRSWRTLSVNIQGSKVPLYGAGPGFVFSNNNPNGVPMMLDFEITTQGNVVAKLVKAKHRRHIQCSFTISSYTTQMVHFGEHSCVYM